VIVTRSKPTAFPSSLRDKRSDVQTVDEDDLQTNATIEVSCEKCGRETVRFYTQQLRGADEGSTVFYTCKCGNKYGLDGPILVHDLICIQVDHEQLIMYEEIPTFVLFQ
jgi:DNA-directed RNA polymerase subunit M/transcription elongation factor TFIIS